MNSIVTELCIIFTATRIFGPKSDEETGGWRRVHNEELHNLYSSPSIIRIINSEMGGACNTNGGEEECI
jgi:hypothetical protein